MARTLTLFVLGLALIIGNMFYGTAHNPSSMAGALGMILGFGLILVSAVLATDNV